MRNLKFNYFLTLGLILSGGCHTDFVMENDMGVVAGGAQDIGYAREVIAAGGVPGAESITVGGLLNEHDLPLGVDDCDEVLCMDGAAGVGMVDVEGMDSVFVQLGYDTALTADSFQRADQNLVVVIDISGSMGNALPEIKFALVALLDQLHDGDALGIVTYGSKGEVLLDLTETTAGNLDLIASRIEQLGTGGSTNMEEGLQLGYRMAQEADSSRQTRVMLFTDVQPNTGDTSAGGFVSYIEEGAAEDIGFTLFGIGNTFGYELALEISDYPLSNYFFLDDEETIKDCFDGLDMMVTPIARDVQISASTAPGYELLDAYNAVAAEGEGPLVEATIPTLFLSEGNGATIFRLGATGDTSPVVGSTIATLSLSYEDLLLDAGEHKDMEVTVHMSDAAGGFEDDQFGHESVRKSAVLVNAALSMIDLCDAFHTGDPVSALDTFDATLTRLEAEADALGDEDLSNEVALLERLRENVLSSNQ